MIKLPLSDEALLKECRVMTYRSSGAGGQHVNKTDTAVRLLHLPTGIAVTSQKERSQYLNKMECCRKLREKIKALNWVKPKRIKTAVSYRVKKKNREKKELHSTKKKLRSKIDY